MKTEERYLLIERYIQNELSDKDRNDFEKNLESDTELREELKLHRSLHSEFSEDVLDLRSKLGEISQKSSSIEKEKTSKLLKLVFKYSAIAAVLLLGIIFLPKLINTATNSDQIYASNYEPYPMVLNQRGTDGAKFTPMLNQAIEYYISNDFTNAAELFEAVYEVEKNDLYMLYAANAYQASNEFEKSIELYDIIISNREIEIIQQAQWFKSLSLLKIGRIDEALLLLNTLDSNHYKYSSIQNIINQIESN